MSTKTKLIAVGVGLGVFCVLQGYLISAVFFFGGAALAKKFMRA